MTYYMVSLRFDIKSDSPRKAAEMVQILARDTEHFWTYEVVNIATNEILKVDLDLDE